MGILSLFYETKIIKIKPTFVVINTLLRYFSKNLETYFVLAQNVFCSKYLIIASGRR